MSIVLGDGFISKTARKSHCTGAVKEVSSLKQRSGAMKDETGLCSRAPQTARLVRKRCGNKERFGSRAERVKRSENIFCSSRNAWTWRDV